MFNLHTGPVAEESSLFGTKLGSASTEGILVELLGSSVE
jgi:hypothetical protein